MMLSVVATNAEREKNETESSLTSCENVETESTIDIIQQRRLNAQKLKSVKRIARKINIWNSFQFASLGDSL